mgnify:CR=1 FL=1
MKRSSLSVLPKGIREDVEGVFRPDTEEIRVRANRPVQLRGPQSILLNRIASAEECETMLELVCAHSLFAYEQELRGADNFRTGSGKDHGIAGRGAAAFSAGLADRHCRRAGRDSCVGKRCAKA